MSAFKRHLDLCIFSALSHNFQYPFLDSVSNIHYFVRPSQITDYNSTFIRWIADSPRWLLSRNKFDRALEQLLNSATLNHRSIPLDLEEKLANQAKHLQQAATRAPSYWSIWDKTTERRYICCVHVAWVGAMILHNVTLLMIRTMGTEYIHVNTVCLGKLQNRVINRIT